MIKISYDTAFDANDAPIIATETDVSEMYISYADISSYAREAFENKQTHFYVAVGSWNYNFGKLIKINSFTKSVKSYNRKLIFLC